MEAATERGASRDGRHRGVRKSRTLARHRVGRLNQGPAEAKNQGLQTKRRKLSSNQIKSRHPIYSFFDMS